MAFNIKKVALALAIIIVLNLFVYTGIRTFYKGPDRIKYCGDLRGPILNEVDCNAAGGQWVPEMYEPGMAKPVTSPSGYCSEKPLCYTLYDEAAKPYNRNVFIIYAILGLLSLLLGFWLMVDAVSAGFNFGAIVLLFTGTVRYWSSMQEYLRFIIVGLALVVAIWLGYKKLKR